MDQKVSWIVVAMAALLCVTPASGELVASVQLAESQSRGTLEFGVDPTADPQVVIEEIEAHLELGGGARLTSVKVEDGIATVTFADADPGALVEASLPLDLIATLGVSPLTTGVEALLGGGLPLGVVGGLLGAFGAASGSDGEDTVVSPSR